LHLGDSESVQETLDLSIVPQFHHAPEISLQDKITAPSVHPEKKRWACSSPVTTKDEKTNFFFGFF